MECYDAGIISEFGRGNVVWWQDYIRAELARAHEFYCEQASSQEDEIERLQAIVAGVDDAVYDSFSYALGPDTWEECSLDFRRTMKTLAEAKPAAGKEGDR
jgi:hypothetical protein